MSREVGIGVIGLGGMARHHIERLGEVEGAKIVALCDVSPEALAEVGDRLGVPEMRRYRSGEALISDPEVEGIVAVTPNDSHAAILLACIGAGKPLFAEKPLTRTLDEAREVAEAYRRSPMPLLINFSYRNGPAFQYARRFVAEGRLGRLNHLFVQYLQDWGATVKDAPFLWRFDEAVAGTGALGDLGSHMMDLAEYLTGSRMVELQAMLSTIVPQRRDPKTGAPAAVRVDDFACLNARFASGAIGVFQTSRNALGSGNQHEIALYGEKGTLRVSTLNDRELVWIYPAEDGQGTVTETIAVPESEGLNPWAAFVDGIRSGRPLRPDFAGLEDGYRNQRLLEAVVQAHLSRAAVPVEAE
ncbi:Gfo/Idh/MocA family protein [Cohnella hongkongensis]|uniref:Gfo/Idh/MocA family protein n=1 Tax=Cohnella hongkongensis TaxID=178337 RepID=A0ABV9F4J0_9BACL